MILINTTTLTSHAQEAPTTIWSSLGIGADQYSQNPAIKAAAKAKAAKHKICKKKKALEYLANMGCSPEHPEVGPAIVAAMGDPDEPVRYAAVQAALKTASGCQSKEQKKSTRKALGCIEVCHDLKKTIKKKFCDFIDRIFGKAPPKERVCVKKMQECQEKVMSHITGKPVCKDYSKEECPCGNGHGPCCSPDMRKKLEQLAYGRDENGCFLETSERVRTVAELALQACQACDCQQFASGFNSQVVRELPIVTDRELPYSDENEPRCIDRPLFTIPPNDFNSDQQPTPAATPESLQFPVEQLPPPSPQAVSEKPVRQAIKSVLLRRSKRSTPSNNTEQEDRYAEIIPHPWIDTRQASTESPVNRTNKSSNQTHINDSTLQQHASANAQNSIHNIQLPPRSTEHQRSFLENNPRWAGIGLPSSHSLTKPAAKIVQSQSKLTRTAFPNATATKSKQTITAPRIPSTKTTVVPPQNNKVVAERNPSSESSGKHTEQNTAALQAPRRVTWLRIPATLITLAVLIQFIHDFFIVKNRPNALQNR